MVLNLDLLQGFYLELYDAFGQRGKTEVFRELLAVGQRPLHELLNRAIELSSRGIRVSPDSLRQQLEIRGCPERQHLYFHRTLLDGSPRSLADDPATEQALEASARAAKKYRNVLRHLAK